MSVLPITRVVLYKHGVGYFERQGPVEGEAALSLTFKQAEVSDVLKSLTVLDLDGGHVAAVSYDSTKPLEQLLAEVALSIPDQGSLVGLLPQIKGARIAAHPASSGTMGIRPGSQAGGDPIEGILLGLDTAERQSAEGIVHTYLLSVLTDAGEVRTLDLLQLARLEILDPTLRRDLDFYLKTQLSAKKKESRTFTFFAQGSGKRTIRLSYTLEAPVWKATYRILLGEPAAAGSESASPMIQGWAVIDNTQDEDWENVRLTLVAGLPVSFVHDLYTPRYIRRPVVAVRETTGVLPPELEESMAAGAVSSMLLELADTAMETAAAPEAVRAMRRSAVSSVKTQVRERKVGDLFEYEIEHPVTIRRNQSALVPIVLRSFSGRPVLLYNKEVRAENPMRCVEFENTTGLTLEGGPVTVLEGGSYVGEAMLDTIKPGERRLVPYSVELGVSVLDNLHSFDEQVHRVVIRKGAMKTQYTQVQQTTYTFHNKSNTPQIVYLDHSRQGLVEWVLFDTPEPHEVTKNCWRFRFSLPTQQVFQFVVRQRRTLHQSYGLGDTPEPQLVAWIEQRYVDPGTAQVLRQAIELRQQLSAVEERIKRLQQEREVIHNEQKRIRENLQSLGDRTSEKELRERFVRILNSQEDRLEQIEQAGREQMTARERAREQLTTLLAQLEYEADVPPPAA